MHFRPYKLHSPPYEVQRADQRIMLLREPIERAVGEIAAAVHEA